MKFLRDLFKALAYPLLAGTVWRDAKQVFAFCFFLPSRSSRSVWRGTQHIMNLGRQSMRRVFIVFLVCTPLKAVKAAPIKCTPHRVPDYSDQYEPCLNLSGLQGQKCLNRVASQELLAAVQHNDFCWAQDVLQRYDVEPDVNWQGDGQPALYFAALNLNPNLVQLLLNKGAMLCGQHYSQLFNQIHTHSEGYQNYVQVQELLNWQHTNRCDQDVP